MAEQVPDFDHFDHDDAWRVGSTLVDRCRTEGHAVAIAIWLGEQRVFHAAMRGTSADNDGWVDRKARVVRRFACSSLEVHERHVSDNLQFFTAFGLSAADYAPWGGAVPIRVRGALVGVIAVSGLESGEDHDLAVWGLRAELR
ncbi:MAG TPA: heme-binding protein [Gemmataceae bacterium]|nr:heme-binding protein [Gemmataceae bacterium]